MILSPNYNPDVLTCLANLSNDEVFTPPQVVNRMLDMLPAELFLSKETKFLDPVSKSGVFLREIAKRLMIGLERQIPDIYERADHIFTHQLYGIAITELTALTSRRSLYCSKHANGKYSICRKFQNEEGNLRFKAIEHKFVAGKCKYCGASESVFGKNARTDLESHAYEFIHTDKPEKIFGNMKFDVIIGNPPYQLEDGGGRDSAAIPLYQKFVEQAKKLSPRFLTMIIPARWYSGGRGLDDFRDEMLNDQRLKVLRDFPETNDCFPGLNIRGGVCYFLWDRDYKGPCHITNFIKGVQNTDVRYLKEEGCPILIRYNQSISILHKVQKLNEETFNNYVSVSRPFGMRSNFDGFVNKQDEKNFIRLYRFGENGYVSLDKITNNNQLVSHYKVIVSKASPGGDEYPHSIVSAPIISEPNSVCTETYLVIKTVPSLKQAQNLISYIKTRFFRFMMSLVKNTQNISRGSYQFVPLQDFSHPWTDEMLYKKYGLKQPEIDFIESMIRPME
ncbi:MAG: Eco57I restriction-modification methylase domain-containing protein [Bacteroidales bacterium]|nr:Eco57I restriction-modification methylase domain-containing protein [Bacteroidales bacterium]